MRKGRYSSRWKKSVGTLQGAADKRINVRGYTADNEPIGLGPAGALSEQLGTVDRAPLRRRAFPLGPQRIDHERLEKLPATANISFVVNPNTDLPRPAARKTAGIEIVLTDMES